MALMQLQLTEFRNIHSAVLQFSPTMNLICGENGSGKTSVLEAVYLLAHGRSFRTTKAHKMIKHQQSQLVLHGKVNWAQQLLSVGMQRDRNGELQLRLNGEKVLRIADIASLLPVQLITPESFRLFFGGPKERRQFFDLGLFHVEPSFYELWVLFNKVLKQRNALLKSKQQYNDSYSFWDQQLADTAIAIQELRQKYIAQLDLILRPLLQPIAALADLELELVPGWICKKGDTAELLVQLQVNFQSDLKVGYTQLGPQKADLRIKVGGEYVDEFLSRGQLKVLLFALKVAQSNLIFSSGHKQPLLLIDDLASELDEQSKRFIFSFLHHINSQVFITAIEAAQVLPHVSDTEVGLFHVEHGQIVRTDEHGRRT
jgi:DNA replication and repair protein RecF